MSRRINRAPTTTATTAATATETTPALVNRATPADAVPVPGGVLPEGTPTTPAVPSTEPLPSDQATAAERPVDVGFVEADAPHPAADRLDRDRPSIVPETPPAEALVAPADPAAEARSTVVMERVPGTVPLPADQITPVAPVAEPSAASLASSLALLTEDDRDAMRSWLGVMPTDGSSTGAQTGDDRFAGKRQFPVAYEVDHDGHVYTPGGSPITLTFAEHRHFTSATAVKLGWLQGEVVDE